MMTITELRRLLFELDHNDITVKELRKLLFDVEDQEKDVFELTYYFLTRSNNEK